MTLVHKSALSYPFPTRPLAYPLRWGFGLRVYAFPQHQLKKDKFNLIPGYLFLCFHLLKIIILFIPFAASESFMCAINLGQSLWALLTSPNELSGLDTYWKRSALLRRFPCLTDLIYLMNSYTVIIFFWRF